MRHCTNRTKDLKTNELIGRALAYAVGIAKGYKVEYWHTKSVAILSAGIPRGVPWNPHIDWSQGGPIIEREGINTLVHVTVNDVITEWKAGKDWPMSHFPYYTGPTPLIAAMRCYVASKLGDEVEIPEELK